MNEQLLTPEASKDDEQKEQELSNTDEEGFDIQENLNKLKLGRNRCRPRKINQMNNFFDFALKNKRQKVIKQKRGSKKEKEITVPVKKSVGMSGQGVTGQADPQDLAE